MIAHPSTVIPAQAGTQTSSQNDARQRVARFRAHFIEACWVPACAGMTVGLGGAVHHA